MKSKKNVDELIEDLESEIKNGKCDNARNLLKILFKKRTNWDQMKKIADLILLLDLEEKKK